MNENFRFPHLFDFDQTFLTADGFTAVLPLQLQRFVDKDGGADVTGEHREVLDSVVVDEAGVAAHSKHQAIQALPDFALRMTREDVHVTAG